MFDKIYPRAGRFCSKRPTACRSPMRWTVLLFAAVMPSSDGALIGKLFKRSGPAPSVTPMEGKVDPKRLMGTWYVQRQKPALGLLENGARNGVEKYELNDDGSFAVEYTLNRKNADKDAVTTVRQRGWFASERGTQWEVAPVIGSFRPPVRLPFIILDADPKTFMVCTGGLKSWMYVMTRERKPDAALVDACLATVAAAGFDMSRVQIMEHDGS